MLSGKMTIKVPFLREWTAVGASLLCTVERVEVNIVEMGLKKFLGLEGSCFVAASPWARQRVIHGGAIKIAALVLPLHGQISAKV